MERLNSAAGVLAMLEEPNQILKIRALKNLNHMVEKFWPEISTRTTLIKSLFENEEFEQQDRELASLVLSKVFFSLNDLKASLSYVLGAGSLFDIFEDSCYIDTLIAEAVHHNASLKSKAANVDSRLDALVKRIIDKCIMHGQSQQAIGVAIECRLLDKLQEVIRKSDNVDEALAYCTNICHSFIDCRGYRHEVICCLVEEYQRFTFPDYMSICQCMMFLEEPEPIASILVDLLQSDHDYETLLAFQIAFDLLENDNPTFLASVSNYLKDVQDHKVLSAENLTKVEDILSGKRFIQLTSDFLSHHNMSCGVFLERIMASAAMEDSLIQSGCMFAYAIMNARTSVPTATLETLMKRLDRLNPITEWGQFSVVAALGVLYQGNWNQGDFFKEVYLSQGEHRSSYSEGGALYALGLIHSNHGNGIKQFLLERLRSTTIEVVQHGACLGLGLSALGTGDKEIFNDIDRVLQTDSAVAGAAAGVSMGLVMAGTASEEANRMLSYARVTPHENISRALAFGIALMVYGSEEKAVSLIEQMTADQNPIIREGGMYAVALAYRGTANTKAIRKLLHFASSDWNNDVKRNAVVALGFILYSHPQQTPQIFSLLSLLSESHNPHVRYGAAFAIGISCAGTGLSEAITLLEPLMSDDVDFVRQGALIAMAMVMVQITEARDSRVEAFRLQLERVILDEYCDTTTKRGAILASGIVDAGGRNVNFRLISKTKHHRLTSLVGLAVFSHSWYWHPLTHCLSLAFSPTAFIGLNSDLEVPVFDFQSFANPSLFQIKYPTSSPTQISSAVKLPCAILSTSAKAIRAMAKKQNAIQNENAEKLFGGQVDSSIEKKPEPVALPPDLPVPPDHPIPPFEILCNPARVVPAQEEYIRFYHDSRHDPIKFAPSGVVLLIDKNPCDFGEDDAFGGMVPCAEPNAVRILLISTVDDAIIKAKHLECYLQDSYWEPTLNEMPEVYVSRVKNTEEATACIYTFRYHLVLFDYQYMKSLSQAVVQLLLKEWRELYCFQGSMVALFRTDHEWAEVNAVGFFETGFLYEDLLIEDEVIKLRIYIQSARERWAAV